MKNDVQKVIIVSSITKKRLEEMKEKSKKEGFRETLGGIVDRLVKDEYGRTKKEA